MSKDFLLGFLAGILFILVLFMMSPPSPIDKRRKQQPVTRKYDTTSQDWWREGAM